MIIKRISFLSALLLLCWWPSPVTRQVIAARTPDPVYLFIEVEAKVYRKGVEISSENPEERRWYSRMSSCNRKTCRRTRLSNRR